MNKQIRESVKSAIIENGGKIYNSDYQRIKAEVGCDVVEFQNACNYFRFSPQQATFRTKYDFH